MRIAPRGVLPDAPAEPEDLIREARRRQHRRWIAAGATGVVLLAGVAGVVADLAGHRHGRASSFGHTKTKTVPRPEVTTPTPIPRSIGTTLLMWPVGYPGFGPSGGPPAYVDDLSKGRLASSQKPAISAGDFQPLLAHVGRWFVYVGNGATAIRDDLTGHPRVLGPTSFFAPAAEPGRVWLFQLRNGQKRPARARTVALSGGPPSQPVTLPANAYLPAIRGTDAGLLLQVPQGLALWNPGSAPGPCRIRLTSLMASMPPRGLWPTERDAAPKPLRRTRPASRTRAITCAPASASGRTRWPPVARAHLARHAASTR